MLPDHLFSWSTLCTKWHKLHPQEAEAETERGCKMLIRDLTFNRKGKGSRIEPKDKLNCDTDRRVSTNPAESSKTTMLFQSPASGQNDQIFVSPLLLVTRSRLLLQGYNLWKDSSLYHEQILKKLTAVKCWLSFL